MPRAFAKVMFTPGVVAHQKRMGSDKTYARFLTDGPEQGRLLGEAEKAFIEARDGFYQATVSETGWPYVQFRGGPVGFLRVLNSSTIAYADLSGNKQYISRGNLDHNDRIAMILMDYPNRARIKIVGRASFVEGEGAATALYPPGAEAKAERAVRITVEAFEWNCPKNITPRFSEAELAPSLQEFGQEIGRLRAENARLKDELARLQRG